MITADKSPSELPLLDELPTEDFLLVVGQRVRQQRARKSMSRKRLAEVSSVSERYLAQLESGQGNMSIALLRKVTAAIGMSLGALMSEEVTETCAQNTSLADGRKRTGAGHVAASSRAANGGLSQTDTNNTADAHADSGTSSGTCQKPQVRGLSPSSHGATSTEIA